MDASFFTFLAVAVLVIVTPGPDTALTIRNTLLGGRRAGIGTALGVSTGQLLWATATSLGLVALLLASEPVFRALRLMGAAYLAYLGARSLREAWRGTAATQLPLDPLRRSSLGGASAFRQGVLNNIANPKMAVFFASVLPQFAPAGLGMWSALVRLGLVFAALTFLWLTCYAIALSIAGRLLRGSRLGRVLNGLAGAALIGLGGKIALEEPHR